MSTVYTRVTLPVVLTVGVATALWLALAPASAQDSRRQAAAAPAARITAPLPASTAIIVQPDEPGPRLLIVGRIENSAGRPIAGASVTAYNTDITGLYNPPSSGTREPRIRGTVITDAEGRFQFLTVRPAPYPEGDEPAHVHLMIAAPSYVKTYSDIWFEGDPLITPERLADAKRDMDNHPELILKVQRVETGPGGLETVRHTVTLAND